MTEAEWISSNDPAALLRWMTYTTGGDMGDGPPLWFSSDRKLQLFACACCRQVWDQITDPRNRRAVEVAERYADGLATEEGRLRAVRAERGPGLCPSVVNTAVWLAVRESLSVGDFSATINPDRVVSLAAQAALLRCVIGNPWRPVELPGPPCPDCAPGEPDENCDDCGGDGTVDGPCPWLTPAVLAVARSIYDERRPADLPVLADALLEAECPEEVACPACGGYGCKPSPSRQEFATCRQCRGAGRVPNPLLAHLRQVGVACPACGGQGDFVTPWPNPSVDGCDLCGGAGLLKGVHAIPGCWVIDLVLGKE